MPLFAGNRRQPTAVAAPPVRNVGKRDVDEDIRTCFVAGLADPPLAAFGLQQREEAFGHGVFLTVASSTHADFQVVVLKKPPPVTAGVLVIPPKTTRRFHVDDHRPYRQSAFAAFLLIAHRGSQLCVSLWRHSVVVMAPASFAFMAIGIKRPGVSRPEPS